MDKLSSSTIQLLILLGFASLGGHSLPARAAGDAARGADVFAQECAECHSPKEGKNKKGPSSFGVVGRRAASLPDFVYSEALKQSGITWSTERLDAYIANPRGVVSGGKMKYDGLESGRDRTDLLAYLATLR
ncbi:MAG: c-type cytochrome [Rhodocyclaceae bacterium]|nr:c-type cytochrome [Rhodocyclaceae bacterium]